MKVTFLLISMAVLYAHVARGVPVDAKDEKKPVEAEHHEKQDDHAAAAPQAAPAAPEKPETCKANINGGEQTLNTGDRYCLDDNTHRVCNYGDWIDDKCPEGSKCLKAKDSWQVLCRIVHRNAPQPDHPQDTDVQHESASKPDAPSNPAPSAPKEEPKPQPAPSQPEQPSNPAPPKEEPKKEEPAPAPAPTKEEPKPAASPPAQAPPAEIKTADKPAPAPAPAQPEGTPKPETCKASIDGQEQTLQPGDRYCLNESTNRVCNWGEFVDFECPGGSKCLKSPDKWQVLCRVINKNPSQAPPGADGH